MARVTSIKSKGREKGHKSGTPVPQDGFIPCSPDMTICGDCDDNREKNNCPRLKEWLAKRGY